MSTITEEEQTFGAWLRELRLQAGFSQSEASYEARVPASKISWYEMGHEFPSIRTLSKLLEAYGQEVPWPKGRYLNAVFPGGEDAA
jgi:transcriptional regulator with XRE-family HTH domain